MRAAYDYKIARGLLQACGPAKEYVRTYRSCWMLSIDYWILKKNLLPFFNILLFHLFLLFVFRISGKLSSNESRWKGVGLFLRKRAYLYDATAGGGAHGHTINIDTRRCTLRLLLRIAESESITNCKWSVWSDVESYRLVVDAKEFRADPLTACAINTFSGKKKKRFSICR